MKQKILSPKQAQRVGTLTLVGLAALLPACDGGVRGLFDRIQNSDSTAELDDTEIQQYIGQNINASGVIQEMVGDAAFFLEEQSLFTDRELLVINAAKTPVELPDESDINLQVSGQLQQLDIAQIEQTYNTTLDPELSQYQGEPVIIAEAITVETSPGDL